MGETSSIEWTDATWNPWRGCDKVSPGCAHCYMFRDQRRYGRDPSVVVRASDSTFYAPLRAKKWRGLPAGSLVFTCSWSDWFHEDADPWRDEAWEVVRARPDLRWQILTKRPELIADRLPADWGEGWPNVWLGVSIENRRFVSRADVLREVPAAIRFVSAEPLLGPLVSCRRCGGSGGQLVPEGSADGATTSYERLERLWCPACGFGERHPAPGEGLDLSGIDWLIVGGESGSAARRMDLAWARDLLYLTRCDRCLGTGLEQVPSGCFSADLRPCPGCNGRGYPETAFFLKQLGGARPGTALEDLPPGLRVRQFPERRSAGTAIGPAPFEAALFP